MPRRHLEDTLQLEGEPQAKSKATSQSNVMTALDQTVTSVLETRTNKELEQPVHEDEEKTLAQDQSSDIPQTSIDVVQETRAGKLEQEQPVCQEDLKKPLVTEQLSVSHHTAIDVVDKPNIITLLNHTVTTVQETQTDKELEQPVSQEVKEKTLVRDQSSASIDVVADQSNVITGLNQTVQETRAEKVEKGQTLCLVYQLKKELLDVQLRLATVMDENDQLKTKTAVMMNKEMAQEVVDLKAVCQKLKEAKRKETLGLMLEMAMLSESLAEQKGKIDKLNDEIDAKDKTIADLQSKVDALTWKSGQQGKMDDQNDKDAQLLSHM